MNSFKVIKPESVLKFETETAFAVTYRAGNGTIIGLFHRKDNAYSFITHHAPQYGRCDSDYIVTEVEV